MNKKLITLLSLLSEDKISMANILHREDKHLIFFDSDPEDEGTTNVEEILIRLCADAFSPAHDDSDELRNLLHEINWVLFIARYNRYVPVNINLKIDDDDNNKEPNLIWCVLNRYARLILKEQNIEKIKVNYQDFLNLLISFNFSFLNK